MASLEHLSYLDLRDNQLEDLSPAGGLKNLKVLYVQGNMTNQYESLSAVARPTAAQGLLIVD